LHGAAALLVVLLLPALESSAFVGLILRGEIAVLLGGVLAFQHRVPLAAVMAVAVAGAPIGDAIGYAVGRRWGRRLLRGRIGGLVGAERLDRAETYLRERGGKAVSLGRWTAALRALIPGLAGMLGMPYRTFTVYNVVGGTVWRSPWCSSATWRARAGVASRRWPNAPASFSFFSW
jgi:undecaprenyl-diphosphatase